MISFLLLLLLCFVTGYIISPLTVAAFQIFSLSLILSNLIMMCLDVVFFMFLVLGVHCISCICEFVVFTNFENFPSKYFFKYFFFLCHSFLSPLFMTSNMDIKPIKLSHSSGFKIFFLVFTLCFL